LHPCPNNIFYLIFFISYIDKRKRKEDTLVEKFSNFADKRQEYVAASKQIAAEEHKAKMTILDLEAKKLIREEERWEEEHSLKIELLREELKILRKKSEC